MENNELVEALRLKIEALEIKNEALAIKIEALEMKNSHLKLLHDTRAEVSDSLYDSNDSNSNTTAGETFATGKKRGRPKGSTTQIARMQAPLEREIRNILSGERFNRATFRAVTGILLCLYENGQANVNKLYEYVGGSRVTIVRHTALMKKLDLLRYEGSRKKGYYVLTDNGKSILEQVASAQ